MRHLKNLWSNLKLRFFKPKEELPSDWDSTDSDWDSTISDWDSTNLENLFNIAFDAKQTEISDALQKRNAAVAKFLKEEKSRFETSQAIKKAMVFCDVTKIPRYETIEEVEDAIDLRLMELNDLAKLRDIQLSWLSHLENQKERLVELKAKETDLAVETMLTPPPELKTADAARWQEPGDSRLPRAQHRGCYSDDALPLGEPRVSQMTGKD
jgi:hypothetical protein